MNTVITSIAYLLQTNPDNEVLVRQDMAVRCFVPEYTEKLIVAARKLKKDGFKLGRMLANVGVRTDLSVSDMLTYALITDNMSDVKTYLEAVHNQDTDVAEMAADALAYVGIPDTKSISRIVNDLRDTASKAHRRKKNKRSRDVAPHRRPQLEEPDEEDLLDEDYPVEDGEQLVMTEVIDDAVGVQLTIPGILD